MRLLGGTEYVIHPSRRLGPSEGFPILDALSESPLAIVREEPWPEMSRRPWPDGTARRGCLSGLVGAVTSERAVRTAVRSAADGRAALWLHWRAPVFYQTVGIFDAQDRRVGYCRSQFKSTLWDEFAVCGIDQEVAAKLRKTAEGSYRFVAPEGPAEFGRVDVSRDEDDPGSPACYRVGESESAGPQPMGLFLLAAALTLISILERRQANETTPTEGRNPS